MLLMISYIMDMKRNRADEYEKLIRGYKDEESMLKELFSMTSKAVEAIKNDSKKLS